MGIYHKQLWCTRQQIIPTVWYNLHHVLLQKRSPFCCLIRSGSLLKATSTDSRLHNIKYFLFSTYSCLPLVYILGICAFFNHLCNISFCCLVYKIQTFVSTVSALQRRGLWLVVRRSGWIVYCVTLFLCSPLNKNTIELIKNKLKRCISKGFSWGVLFCS